MNIAWTCTTCQKRIYGPGLLWVDLAEIAKVDADLDTWHDTHPDTILTGHDLDTYPEPAEWHVTHHGHCADTSARVYAIELGEARTYQQLLGWTAHVMEKTWHTNWLDLIRTIANQKD